MPEHRILAVNLGVSSSKFALYDDGVCVAQQSFALSEAQQQAGLAEQRELRAAQLRQFLDQHGIEPASLSAAAARGGLTRPLPEYGAYTVDEQLLDDLATERYGSHPAGLSAQLAVDLLAAAGHAAPVYVVDPISIDTLWPRARLSGLAGLQRRGRHHALNVHAAMQAAARRLGQPLHRLALVIGHFGSGVSICSVVAGRVVDVNNAQLGEGPFSVSRAGSLPLEVMLELTANGASRGELELLLSRRGGLASYTGSADLAEVERRMDSGDVQAGAAYEAMLFQSAKYIAAAAGALGRRPDAVVLTGGLINSARFARELSALCDWIAPLIELPAEDELGALAAGVLAVLRGEQPALSYREAPDPQDCPPRDFDELIARAAAAPACSFIVAGAEQAGVAQSVALCRQRGLGSFVLLGDKARIEAQLAEIGVSTGAEVIESADVVADALALAARRPNAVLVKGGCDSAKLLKGVLESLPKAQRPFLSHVALIENPFGARLLALSDGGLNVDPDCAKKIRIMENGARLLRALGQRRPRVLLAAGMEDKGQSAPAVADAREILRRHRAGEWPDLLLDGPYGLDVAISAEAAQAKGIHSPLAGRADLVLCPDLESCNFAVKMAALYGQGRWAGVVVGGACPVVIGSRADEAPSRLASIALASIAAGMERG